MDGNAVYPYVPKKPGCYEFCLKKIRVYDLTGFFYVTRRLDQCVSVDVLPEICYVPVQLTDAVRNFFGDADLSLIHILQFLIFYIIMWKSL